MKINGMQENSLTGASGIQHNGALLPRVSLQRIHTGIGPEPVRGTRNLRSLQVRTHVFTSLPGDCYEH